MIKNFTPQPYDGPNPLPDYVTDIRTFELVGTVPGGYIVTLGKLTVGESMSAGNPLTHVIFESFSDHGVRQKVARTRVSGCDREFVAVKSAMMKTGVEFYPSLPNSPEDIMRALGDWFGVINEEITEVSVVSQTSH